MEFVQFEAESRAVSIGKPCRSLRKHHAAVSGIDVPLERNLHSWELALYIFCVDGNIPILREPVRFEYRDKNNKKHYYYPDFQVGEDLSEIKGDQFFDTSGVFINPRTKLPDSEKYACMMVNNVQIVRYADCEPFITYCVNKYNDKHWYKQFVYRKDK